VRANSQGSLDQRVVEGERRADSRSTELPASSCENTLYIPGTTDLRENRIDVILDPRMSTLWKNMESGNFYGILRLRDFFLIISL